MPTVNRFTREADGTIFIIENEDTIRPAREDEVDWLEFLFNEENKPDFHWYNFDEE